MKITNHHQELRRDVSVDCTQETHGGGADQSSKNECDINFIMAQYAKNGLFHHLNSNEPRYIDNTEIPDLVTAFNISNRALDLFDSLPAEVRRLMDNDPSQLESFVSDPLNTDILLKHGLAVKKVDPNPSGDPPPVGSTKET